MKKYETFSNEKELNDRIDFLKNNFSKNIEYDITNTLEERKFILSYKLPDNNDLDEEGLKDQNSNFLYQNDRPQGYSTEFNPENGVKNKDK